MTNDTKIAIFEVGYFSNQNSELTFENDLEELGLSSFKTVHWNKTGRDDD